MSVIEGAFLASIALRMLCEMGSMSTMQCSGFFFSDSLHTSRGYKFATQSELCYPVGTYLVSLQALTAETEVVSYDSRCFPFSCAWLNLIIPYRFHIIWTSILRTNSQTHHIRCYMYIWQPWKPFGSDQKDIFFKRSNVSLWQLCIEGRCKFCRASSKWDGQFKKRIWTSSFCDEFRTLHTFIHVLRQYYMSMFI